MGQGFSVPVEGVYVLYHPDFDKYLDLYGNDGGDGQQNMRILLNKRFIVKKAKFMDTMYTIQPFLQQSYVCWTRGLDQLETKSLEKYSERAEWDFKLSDDRTTVQIKTAYQNKYIYANENNNGGRVVLSDQATSWVYLRLQSSNMDLKAGAYYLTNKASLTCVDLNNADPGDNTTVAAYEATPSNDGSRANRQWIIVPQVTNSGSTDLYNIINIRAMSYLISASSSDDNTSVFGGPRNVDDEATGWSITALWDPDRLTQSFLIKQRRHYLNVKNGSSSNGATVHGYTGTTDASHWFLDPATPPIMNMCSWMSYVPDGTPYASMSIPTTHESTALWKWSNSENPHCQNTSIYEQLQSGIRYLDCRFDAVDNMAMATHGMARENVVMGAVMQCIRAFLIQNPTEVVWFSASWEPNNDGFPGRGTTLFEQFDRVLSTELAPFAASVPDLFIGGDFDIWKSLSNSHRGKMALLIPRQWTASVVNGRLFGCYTPGTNTDFFRNSAPNQMMMMGAWGVLMEDNQGQFQNWLQRTDDFTVKIDNVDTSFHGGAFQFIYNAASDKSTNVSYKLSLNASDHHSLSDNLNPIDAASYINPKMESFLRGDITNNNGQQDMKNFDSGPVRLGFIDMDYASDWGRGLCTTIVSFNPSINKDAQGNRRRLGVIPPSIIETYRYKLPKQRGSGDALDWIDLYAGHHAANSGEIIFEEMRAFNASWPY